MTTNKQDDASRAPVGRRVMRDGYDRLWLWFGLTRASWLTMPRIMMHEMPDEWQNKMAELLEEWDDAWDSSDMPDPFVSAKEGNKFTKWPEWLLCYRHPDLSRINALRKVPHNAQLSRAYSAPNETADGKASA
jgi:hypothetical protein